MSKLKIGSLLIIVTLLFSCQSNLRHWVDYEASSEFNGYGSYSIDEQCSDYNPGVNPINQQRIKNAIEVELRSIGYAKSDDPDLMVKFFVKNETKFFYDQCLPDYDRFQGGKVCIDRVYEYEVGTLVIDLIDVRRNTAVWHGGGEGGSWEKMKNPDAKINTMVKTILSEYKKLVKSSSYAYMKN